MTKSQNTKNEQLTEQYNHGNLPDDRLYYYRFKGEPEVQITTQYGLYCEEADNKKEIEVIDFVPTFDELQSMNKAVNQNMDSVIQTNQALCQKLTQLKELLKECKKMLMSSNYQNMTQYHEVLELRDKINKIIGEK